MDPVSLIFAFVMLVASYAITAAITPRTKNNMSPAALKEFDFPQAAEGTPQAVVFGDCWTGDWLVLWYGNLRSTPIKQKGGKK